MPILNKLVELLAHNRPLLGQRVAGCKVNIAELCRNFKTGDDVSTL